MTYFTGFCHTHSRYKAKLPPRSPCAACQKAYDREQQKFKIVRDAADALSELLETDVTLEAKYHRPGLDDAGVRIVVERL